MEFLDILDKNRISTKQVIEKSKIKTELSCDNFVQVIHIVILNSKNEMLIQQRQVTKTIYPNLWDISVGGSVVAGETPCEAASRELFEELGIKIDFSNLRPVLTTNFEYGFDDYFVINKDINLKNIKLQVEEVKDVKFCKLDEILQMIDKGLFIGYNKNFIKLLFDFKDKNLRIIR